jgi:hypothetical protein
MKVKSTPFQQRREAWGRLGQQSGSKRPKSLRSTMRHRHHWKLRNRMK